MPTIDFEPEAQIDFEPDQIDFTPEAVSGDAPRVAQMADATRHTVGVVGRAVAARDLAVAGADAPDRSQLEDGYQPDEYAMTSGPQAPIAARREAIQPLEASSLLAPMFGRFPRVTAQEVSDALSMLSSGSPDLTEEESQAVIDNTTKPGNLEKIIAGAQRAAINIPEAATTPLGVATLGAGTLPATAGRIVSSGFAVDMARHIPEQVGELRAAVLSGDSERITEASGNLLATGLMTGAAGMHAVKRPALPEVAPLTAQATASVTHTAPETVPGSATPLTTAALESVKGAVRETQPPTPAAAAGESGPVSPVTAGETPPAKVEVTQSTPLAKLESEQALTTPEIIGMGGAVPSEFLPARQTATGIKNAAVDAERQSRGQEPILAPQRLANPVVWDSAMARIDREPGWQDRLIEEMKDKPRTPSAEEVVALDHRYVDLQNEYAKATRDGEQHFKDGFADGVQEARERTEFFEGRLAELEQVARNVGTEWGRSGQMRQRLMREDFSLAAMEAKVRASKGFEPLTEVERTEIADLHTKLAEAERKATETEATNNERIAQLEAEKATAEAKAAAKATSRKPKRTKEDVSGRIEDATKAIKAKASGEGSSLHSEVRTLTRLLVEQNPAISRDALIDTIHGVLKESLPETTRLEAMDAISGRGKFWTPRQDEVSKKVRDLSTQIRFVGHQIDVEAGRPMPRTGFQPDKLTEAGKLEKRKLNEIMRQYGVVVTDPARQLGAILQSLKTRMETEKAELQRRLDQGDFSPRRKVRKDLPLDPETAKARGEVLLLREQFKKRLEKHKYEQKSRLEKMWLGAKETLNLSRAMLTSWDVSAVFRQGGFVAFGNPARATRALKPMFHALVSEKGAAASEAQIAARPNAKLYEQSKLFLAPREGKLTGMEEAFMSRLASRIPGIAGSQRAYITFLNKLRADTFDALHESLVSKRGATPEELKAISNYINVATGRGNLGKVAGAAETLATVFFSPRLVASRFQLLFGEPLYRGSAATRFLVAKEYSKFLMGLAAVYGLGLLAGATVETNPRSSDFGKLKFGNTRVDPLGGLSQTAVITSRLVTGEKTSIKGKTEAIRGAVPYGKDTAADVIATFLRTKLSPVAASTVDVASGKNVIGEPVTAKSVAVNAVVPLAFRDIYDVMLEQGIPEGTAIGILSLFGMGVQNYSERPK